MVLFWLVWTVSICVTCLLSTKNKKIFVSVDSLRNCFVLLVIDTAVADSCDFHSTNSCGVVTEPHQHVDECLSFPCLNGGTCLDGKNFYTCVCQMQYTGTQCETHNECFSNPCRNGGTCIDGRNVYECKCPKDYMGENCEMFTKPGRCPAPKSLGDNKVCPIDLCATDSDCSDEEKCCKFEKCGSVCITPLLTVCEINRANFNLQHISNQTSSGYTDHYPQCLANGEYQQHQLDINTGYSWCVSKTGEKIPGSKRPLAAPIADCGDPILQVYMHHV